MKKTYLSIKAILIVAALCFINTSCNDFLNIEPQSDISPEKYLWDEKDLAAYTIRYYAEYNNYNEGSNSQGGRIPSHAGSGGESPYFNDLSTDNATSRGANDRFAKNKLWKVGQKDGNWNFENIYALNYFINTVTPRFEEGKITGNQDKVKHYIGEGYFLRGLEYFYRLKKIGDFPILTENLPDEHDVLVEASKRRPRNEVARFILKDLDEAINLLTNSPDGGKVRITKNAAYLLKARVALFEATWEKYHAGTANVPLGPGWPGATKDYNKDYQFPSGSLDKEVEFFLDEALAASSQVANNIKLTENNKIIRESINDPVNPYYDMFATPDPKNYEEVLMYRAYDKDLWSHSFNHYIYHGAQKGYTHQMEQSILMDNGLPIYASNSQYAGDDYVQDTKNNRDWRWKLFMKAPGEIKSFINYPDLNNLDRFNKAPVIYQTDGKYSTSTGYMIGKGFSHDYNHQILGQDVIASIVYRAAEAYLIYIEACYEKNGSLDNNARKYWKEIRERAGVDGDFQKTISATDVSKEAENDWGAYSKGKLVDPTLYNIRRERRAEFIGEGYRYDDLIRWRAMDQLNGFQTEGCKIWGPMKNDYEDGVLIADGADETKNTISSPSLSEYFRVFQVVKTNNNFYDGFYFYDAHYLDPIAIQHFMITAPDGKTIENSPIYQNPHWPMVAGEGALQ